MKKILVTLAFLVAGTASAFDCRNGVDHKHPSCYHHGNERYENRNPPPTVVYRDDNGWIAPLIFGAVISTMITQQNNRPAEPARVIEPPAPLYKYVQAYDPSCACYKQVLIPIQP